MALPFEVTDAEVGEVGEEAVDLGFIEKHPHEFIDAVHVIQCRVLARLSRVVSRFLDDAPLPPA